MQSNMTHNRLRICDLTVVFTDAFVRVLISVGKVNQRDQFV